MTSRVASRFAPGTAAARGCSGWAASIRTCRAPRRWRWTRGPPSAIAPASGSIIPAMANPAAPSSTVLSGAGSRRASRCSTGSARGPQVVIGSSMGGWMALLLAREIARRAANRASLAGLVLIAPAPDFTEELMWKGFSPEIRRGNRDQGGVAAAVSLWRALSDYARADRRGPPSFVAGQRHRCRMSGADPAGRAGSGRALAACFCAGAAAARRRRGADHDPGRRSPAVAAAGHRADHRGGRRRWGKFYFLLPCGRRWREAPDEG